MKKFLSMFLVVLLIVCSAPVYAEESTENISVYVSVSKYGEIVKDKNNKEMACVNLELNGKTAYNLDDVFVALHNVYYADGSEGYGSSRGNWGLSIDKLWGDTSYNFGYQINRNGNTETVMGLSHTVKDGDYIDAFIYKNAYPATESYSKFNIAKIESVCGESFELTLTYDDNWDNIFSPCEGATITINGAETEFVTDENGKAEIVIENIGTSIISAKKTKTLNEETGAVITVPAITAPVCIAEIKQKPVIEIMHNIAGQYAQSNLVDAGGNLPWIVADMIVYENIFEESENVLSDTQKETATSEIVKFTKEATTPGDLAKSILALRALGYDARKVYTKDFEKIDVVSKLTALIDAGDEGVTNIYTLPYVIIALSQAEDYATDLQMETLINAAISSKDSWQDVTYGTDAMTPMILALSFYSGENDENNEIQTLLAESLEIIKQEQREDGLIDGFEGYESASTGLAICALSAMEIDASEIVKGEKSLIDGLLSTANEEKNGFSNAFATEQGLRGLLAWQLNLLDTGKIMYDFSDFPMNEANVSGADYSPVIFNVTPSYADVVIENAKEISNNCFDLNAGTYTYTISAADYNTTSGIVEITSDDAQERIKKTITVSLTRIYYGGGGGGSIIKDDTKPTEEDEEIEETEETEEIKMTEETFSDVRGEDWYYSAVKYVYENSLFNGTENGFEPNTAMSRAMLVTVLHRLAGQEEASEEIKFHDVPENEWYTESVTWAAKNSIVNGVTDTDFNPNANITREQLAVIIYRYAVFAGLDVSESEKVSLEAYSDCDKVSDYAIKAVKYAVASGIITGKSKDTLAVNEGATRAEVATILMRFDGVTSK